ncbi:hypothetical protein [Haloparvum sp. PAK95]|uniref:hypothetical protein n=1 Tax=Haloparvum sp. PAK95 TaxID=3418962 RepID=UPI003D2E9EC8
MQRRAVAVYVAVFLVVGGAAGTLVATADTPEVSFEDPDFERSAGETFEHAGQTYSVTEVTEKTESGGHGGGASHFMLGTIKWNVTAEASASWSNGSTVTYDGEEWTVVIEGEDPSEVTLREQIDKTAILQNDSSADNETVTSDGEEYVVVRDENGDKTLVPSDEYFPAPEEQTFAEGDSLEYDGNDATIDDVTTSEAVLVWETTENREVELKQGDTVTFGETTYVAHFPDKETLVLSSDQEAYQAQLDQIDTFQEYATGLRRIAAILTMGALTLIGLAFVPSRY